MMHEALSTCFRTAAREDRQLARDLAELGLSPEEDLSGGRLAVLRHFAKVALVHGWRQLQKGEAEEALCAVESVIQLGVLGDDDRFRRVRGVAHFVRGRAREMKGDECEAWSDFAEALRADPEHREARQALWRLVEDLGRIDPALPERSASDLTAGAGEAGTADQGRDRRLLRHHDDRDLEPVWQALGARRREKENPDRSPQYGSPMMRSE